MRGSNGLNRSGTERSFINYSINKQSNDLLHTNGTLHRFPLAATKQQQKNKQNEILKIDLLLNFFFLNISKKK